MDNFPESKRELGLDYEPVAPVQEDWGPGPHECHSLTAAPVQEPVALKPCWYESKEKTMCRKCGQVHAEAIPPTQPAPVQDIGVEQDERVFARIEARKNRDAAHKETAQRSWIGLTDEEVRETISSVHIEPLFSYRYVARAIEAKLKEKNT